jgi:hypothetical protein
MLPGRAGNSAATDLPDGATPRIVACQFICSGNGIQDARCPQRRDLLRHQHFMQLVRHESEDGVRNPVTEDRCNSSGDRAGDANTRLGLRVHRLDRLRREWVYVWIYETTTNNGSEASMHFKKLINTLATGVAFNGLRLDLDRLNGNQAIVGRSFASSSRLTTSCPAIHSGAWISSTGATPSTAKASLCEAVNWALSIGDPPL